MRLKTNIVVSVLFLALLAFVYFYEIKGGEERREQAERSKQLLDFSDHEVARLTIGHGDSTIVVERAQDDWRLIAPVVSAADESAVERYLRNLRETEVERVVEDSGAVADDPSLVAKYGLQSPRLDVLLELTEETNDTVRFGSDSPTERFSYAQRSGANPQIFTVRAWRLDNLDKSVFDLRDKQILSFDEDAVREIRFTRTGEEAPVVLIRNDDDDWTLSSPLRAAADQSEVGDILNALNSGETEEFVHEDPDAEDLAEYGLAPGEATSEVALLIGADRAEKRLSVGFWSGDAVGEFFAKDASRPQVFLIDSTLTQSLTTPLFDLRDKRPSRIEDRDMVTRVALEREGAEVFAAERDSSDSWVIVSPEPRQAKAWKVNGLLTDIDQIEAVEFTLDVVDVAELDMESYGLLEPRLRVVFSVEGAERDEEVRFGDEVDRGVYFTRLGVPAIYRVDVESFENLELELEDVAQKVPDPKPDPAESADSQPTGVSGSASTSAG